MALCDGKSCEAWKRAERWKVEHAGACTVKETMTTKQEFGDCQLHVEFPERSPPKGKGQGRGNNGIGLMGARYEIQVLDSWENPTYLDGMCAALYKQPPPLVAASRKPGECQTYDIVFEPPQFNDKKLVPPDNVPCTHN